jgi:hypothetical protein
MFPDLKENAVPSMTMVIVASWLGFTKGEVQFIFVY